MKQSRFILSMICAATCILLTGCKNKKSDVWDDETTSGNYKGNNRSLFSSDSIARDDDFFGPSQEDFIGLREDDLIASNSSDKAIPQPRFSPGEAGSGIPGIESFHEPRGKEASIFKTVHFKTDDHILRDKEELAVMEKVAQYLKEHANTYIFVEGHCDERAPEAYNLALGARRSNYLRSLLVQKGVNPEQIHTVSYGKERPLATGHSEEAWSKNRRGAFKLYDKADRN